ncbi:MAG: bifunctional demethylmenaquinone methyltransferase/2-methoxy-6-polyprenyl-1,4-benzoquinol methylase UbiE [Armatimonadetes bacterium]|nr:bifunctional demethylmenaquinone methyltransferase/2-methoxy-6-polyprenyl-1,4-benzoquinol methylase UbiE [Armatimonadota bacterium]
MTKVKTPSDPQPIWQREGEAKREAVREMFADIAPTYDRVNTIVSTGQDEKWRRAAVEAINLQPGESVLDLCSGTGAFLPHIMAKVGEAGLVTGVDFCAPMLAEAKTKFGEKVSLQVGDATELPFQAESFDAMTVGWGLRNVPDLDRALSEAARVLKPGGRFVTVDMARPRGLIGPISEWACGTIVPLVGRVFGKTEAYTYLPKSAQRFASREELTAKMEKAGFSDVQFKDFYFGNICMHWGVKK